jgi:TRAP-type C4-dicarboxylate transport system permease small subunit
MAMDQLSPALEIPIWLIYVSIPVCGISMFIRCAVNVHRCLSGRKEV